MRIGILGCEAIKNELEIVTAGDPEVVHREYLDFGLHLNKDELKSSVLEHLKALDDGRVDVVFLGFANCDVLKGLAPQVKVPVVTIETDDCIAALLTPERYMKEKNNGGITWFYPPGWAADGMSGLVRIFHLDSAVGDGYPPEYFLKIMFDGYSRCLFIDTGIEGADQSKMHSEEFAEALGLRHECTKGSLDIIRDSWLKTKTLAAERMPYH